MLQNTQALTGIQSMPLFDVLALYPSFTFISALILGLLVGSFLNVVIYRLPKMMEAEWREQCQQLIYEADHLVVTESEPSEKKNIQK